MNTKSFVWVTTDTNGRRVTKRILMFSSSDSGESTTQRSETVTEGSDVDEMSDITSSMSSVRSDLTVSTDISLSEESSEDHSEDISEEDDLDSSISSHETEMESERSVDSDNVQGGVPQAVIDSLPKFFHKSKAQNKHSKEQTQCLICLGDYHNGDELCILPCAHRYHTLCIHEWLVMNSTCPVCRTSIV